VATDKLPPEVLSDPMAPRSEPGVPTAPPSPVDQPGAKRAMARSPATIVAMVLLVGSLAVAAVMMMFATDDAPRVRRIGQSSGQVIVGS
jgi:hypothetical protein